MVIDAPSRKSLPTPSPFSLQARVVFPVDRPPIEHGVVATDGERIIAVGTAADAVGELHDLGDVALLPGLVNAHTHLEFSDLQQPLGEPGMSLVDWLRLVIAERGGRDGPAAAAVHAGLAESVACGATMLGEIATVDPSVYAVQSCPDLALLAEVIGFTRARAASALAAATERLDAMADHFAKGTRDFTEHRIHLGLSPHAPYTVSPLLVEQLVALARRRHLPVAMHLAESPEELELLATGSGPFVELLEQRSMWDAAAIPRGSRPLDYLRRLAAAPRSLVIHGNYLDAEEREFLAARQDRMSLVFCPRTHAYFDYPPFPIAQLLAAGVHVALGTDSRASNPDLDLLAEMRHVAQTHPAIDPQAILQMGTLAGACALGREGQAGTLTPGKLASIVATPLPAPATGSPEKLLAALFAAEQGQPRPIVWLRGRRVSVNPY